ncbi:MAG TPA: PilZ domain-containing protein, partial [Candidatus Krumholzibacterium sp.]|nr:PilZ domain-containing protein [Candidatus Krumholzibacterium sp.]
VEAGDKHVSRTGFRFDEIEVKRRDDLSRYLFESAVGKFLSEYSNRYETYLERTFQNPREYTKRANRSLSYFPVLIPGEGDESSLGVIRNISHTGFLLASQRAFETGTELSLTTVLGEETVTFEGKVARILPAESEEFPLHYAGIELKEPHSESVDRLIGIAEKTGSLVTR